MGPPRVGGEGALSSTYRWQVFPARQERAELRKINRMTSLSRALADMAEAAPTMRYTSGVNLLKYCGLVIREAKKRVDLLWIIVVRLGYLWQCTNHLEGLEDRLSAAQFLIHQGLVSRATDILHDRDRLQRPVTQQSHRRARKDAPIDVSGAAQHPQRPVLAPRFEAGQERGLDPIFIVGSCIASCRSAAPSDQPLTTM